MNVFQDLIKGELDFIIEENLPVHAKHVLDDNFKTNVEMAKERIKNLINGVESEHIAMIDLGDAVEVFIFFDRVGKCPISRFDFRLENPENITDDKIFERTLRGLKLITVH